MKFLHVVNGSLWTVNAVLWALYAHAPFLAAASAGAALLSFYMARRSD